MSRPIPLEELLGRMDAAEASARGFLAEFREALREGHELARELRDEGRRAEGVLRQWETCRRLAFSDLAQDAEEERQKVREAMRKDLLDVALDEVVRSLAALSLASRRQLDALEKKVMTEAQEIVDGWGKARDACRREMNDQVAMFAQRAQDNVDAIEAARRALEAGRYVEVGVTETGAEVVRGAMVSSEGKILGEIDAEARRRAAGE